MKPMKILLIASIILFVLSLTQKTYCLDGICEARGILNLLIGWMGVLYTKGGSSAWLANPFLIVSWFFLINKPKLAFLLCALAFFFALRFYFQDTLIKNEAGIIGKITNYKAGYWLWLSSTVVMMLASIFSILKIR